MAASLQPILPGDESIIAAETITVTIAATGAKELVESRHCGVNEPGPPMVRGGAT